MVDKKTQEAISQRVESMDMDHLAFSSPNLCFWAKKVDKDVLERFLCVLYEPINDLSVTKTGASHCRLRLHASTYYSRFPPQSVSHCGDEFQALFTGTANGLPIEFLRMDRFMVIKVDENDSVIA